MSGEWQYQLRIYMDDQLAEVARRDPGAAVLKPLADILAKHGASLTCQYDAFARYVAEAEKYGVERFPLYQWTKDTIEDPIKRSKYSRSFTLYLNGDEVYAKDKADALEADLQPLVGGDVVRRLTRHDTNPAHNPQMPERYRK